MATFKQDMPPAGGFPSINYRRDLPKRGLSGWGTFAVGAVVMVLGLSRMALGNKERRWNCTGVVAWESVLTLLGDFCRQLNKEQRERRHGILAVLQAEEDRRYLRATLALWDREAEAMKDVDGWVVGESPYTTRWQPSAANI